MDPVAAKYIGAGIACIGMGGAGVVPSPRIDGGPRKDREGR